MFGSAFVYVVTNAIAAGMPMLLLPILTRVLAPSEYGEVAMFSLIVTLLSAVTGLNVHGAVGMRYFDREEVDFPRYVATCVAIVGASSVIVLGLIGLLSPWLQGLSKLSSRWLVVAVLAATTQSLILLQLAVWQSARRVWAYGALRISQAFLDGALSLVFVLALGLGWKGRVGGMTVAGAIVSLGALALLVREKWFRFPISAEYAMAALRFGVPLVPHVIGGMLIVLIDRVMISNILDVGSTGIYMVAVQIGTVLGLATDAFNRAYAPWLIETLKLNEPDRDVGIVRFTYCYFIVVTVVAALIGLLAPAILSVLAGEKFRGAAPIVVYITLGFAFGGMYYMVTNYVFFAGQTARLAAVTLVCGLCNAALCFGLLHRSGLVGAAQSFMLSQALLFVGTWWLASRARPMPWRRALLISQGT